MNKKIYKLVFVGFLLSLVLVFNPYKLVVVVGNSMYPTFKNGQILLAKKVNNIRRNDIVVINSMHSGTIIKRIALVPGDHYYFYIDKETIYLDDSYETINDFKINHSNTFLYDFDLKKDRYFVLGDNLENSEDSRFFGPIEREEIIYKVINWYV